MNAPMPTTLREEIRQLLAGSESLTRPEIYERCKLAGDETTLSTVLSQLCTAGDIKKAGERERVGARALALYTRTVHDGGSGGGARKGSEAPQSETGREETRPAQEARQARENPQSAAAQSAAQECRFARAPGAGIPLRALLRRLDGHRACRGSFPDERARGAGAVRLPREAA